ncbi:asparagine synthase (glutamine-hydrolyzing) [Algoriphagus sp.]|uniref:asparagine synthase (glutamine-hydrolyzing) n=1 Tax=Algoriphagus sp. TaxID=1872435 RepID=UPI00391B3253
MCGISIIFCYSQITSSYLEDMTSEVSHRGPDDEGYLLVSKDGKIEKYSGKETSKASKSGLKLSRIPKDFFGWKLGFGHRRLAILDSSFLGHQPYGNDDLKIYLTYNGEIFNYLEIKKELEVLGYSFSSNTDTEIIILAWSEWGEDCLNKFNGMFAFGLFETKTNKLYVVRDRFGIKPLYYTISETYLAFSSEVKQLRVLPEYEFNLDLNLAYDFLSQGLVDHTFQTMEKGIEICPRGSMIIVNLETGIHEIKKWYNFIPKPWKGSFIEAQKQYRELLKDSIKIRLRADVKIGGALSGGLDSPTVFSLLREILNERGSKESKLISITSCSEDLKYDEWSFAETVVKSADTEAHKVFPSFEKLIYDLDKIIWHMDYPFASTSMFAQWCVYELAGKLDIKVMLNGQGADEQLGGYWGLDMPLYAGLLDNWNFMELFKESIAYYKTKGTWPKGFLLGALRVKFPAFFNFLLPNKLRKPKPYQPSWLSLRSSLYELGEPLNLKDQLLRHINEDPLPSILRYEDRNSMAFSIESRHPYLDHRLMEFTLGLPERFIYFRGIKKYLTRKTFENLLPKEILERKDKMGFVSPEERWIGLEGKKWFMEIIDAFSQTNPNLVNSFESKDYLRKMQDGLTEFSFEPWRMVCFHLWMLQRQNFKTKI